MNNINGWLNIYKPKGFSSAKAVAIIKRHLKGVKIGHAGTLDPLAEGVLPIAVGEATKLTSYLVDAIKTYEFTAKFGARTDSGDLGSEIIESTDKKVSREEIENIVCKFKGKITQIPSKYSAIKVNGIRAYQAARNGQDIEIPEREIEIYDIKLLEFNEEELTAKFICSCSKGTYIRTLAEDIAFSLQNLAHVIELRRTKVGGFDESSSIILNPSVQDVNFEFFFANILPADIVLDDILVISVCKEVASKIRFGQTVSVDSLDSDLVAIYHESILQAIGSVSGGIFKINRVFNL